MTPPAPAGNPAVIPSVITQPPAPGSRNALFMSGSSRTPNPCTRPEAVTISDRIRKGRSAGKISVHHSLRPCNEAAKEDSGARTMATASRMAAAPDRKGAEAEVICRIFTLFILSFTSS
ncbi:hypothetical protein D3C73_1171660 [compost metagenome]